MTSNPFVSLNAMMLTFLIPMMIIILTSVLIFVLNMKISEPDSLTHLNHNTREVDGSNMAAPRKCKILFSIYLISQMFTIMLLLMVDLYNTEEMLSSLLYISKNMNLWSIPRIYRANSMSALALLLCTYSNQDPSQNRHPIKKLWAMAFAFLVSCMLSLSSGYFLLLEKSGLAAVQSFLLLFLLILVLPGLSRMLLDSMSPLKKCMSMNFLLHSIKKHVSQPSISSSGQVSFWCRMGLSRNLVLLIYVVGFLLYPFLYLVTAQCMMASPEHLYPVVKLSNPSDALALLNQAPTGPVISPSMEIPIGGIFSPSGELMNTMIQVEQPTSPGSTMSTESSMNRVIDDLVTPTYTMTLGNKMTDGPMASTYTLALTNQMSDNLSTSSYTSALSNQVTDDLGSSTYSLVPTSQMSGNPATSTYTSASATQVISESTASMSTAKAENYVIDGQVASTSTMNQEISKGKIAWSHNNSLAPNNPVPKGLITGPSGSVGIMCYPMDRPVNKALMTQFELEMSNTRHVPNVTLPVGYRDKLPLNALSSFHRPDPSSTIVSVPSPAVASVSTPSPADVYSVSTFMESYECIALGLATILSIGMIAIKITLDLLFYILNLP